LSERTSKGRKGREGEEEGSGVEKGIGREGREEGEEQEREGRAPIEMMPPKSKY